MIFVFLLWLPVMSGVYFNKIFLYVFLAIIILSAFNIVMGRDTTALLAKQVIGIFLNAVFFYLLIGINDRDIKSLFKVYLNLAFFAAAIGMIQEVSFILKFNAGYDYRRMIPYWVLAPSSNMGLIRINSFLPEPSSFCNVMMPAFFVSLTSFLKDNFRFQAKWKSLIIIFSFFLTFSSVGYAGIFFSIALLLYHHRNIGVAIVLGAITCILAFFLYNYVSEFRYRVDGSMNVILGKARLEEANVSSYALFSNALVAYHSFKDNPAFGSGLGSHEKSYDRYVGSVVPACAHGYAPNYNDAASMFFRLLSETGLLGVLAFFIFIFKCFIPKEKDTTGYLWIINSAILTMFFIKLLRMGHYFVEGFFFFFWVYYFTKLKMNELTTDRPGKIPACYGPNRSEAC